MRASPCLVLLAGCATVVENERLLSHTLGPQRCGDAELIASAYPGDWPDVIIEVRAERSCTTESEDRFAVTRQLHISGSTATTVAAAVGALIGLGAEIALYAVADRSHAYESFGGHGEEMLLLPMLGALVLGSAVQARASGSVENLPDDGEVRVVKSYDRRPTETAAPDGVLAAPTGPLGTLRGGRVSVPLEQALTLYGRTLWLDARRVDWSVRQGAWVPGLLPSCRRAVRVWKEKSYGRLDAAGRAGASDDAELCAREGWPFARALVNEISEAESRSRQRPEAR